MLNGIGGRTVAEAKRRISHVEFRSWLAYLRKHGSLHTGHRIDLGVARLCSVLGTQGKMPPTDFMPEYEQEDASIDDIAKLMGVKQVKNNG